MYTVCPGCTRQFQIHAEHLAAASGQVRCGFCREQFNAMDRLHDEPLLNEKILKDQLQPESEFPAVPALNPHYDFPDAEEFLQEEEPVKSRWSWLPTFFWTTTSLFALLILLSQLAWFNRDRLLLEYPELKPYAKQLCDEFDCRLIRQRDARAIKLINRDVRLHPGFQDALLVNAAMQNELSVRQPYPRVQLTLFDTSGSLLGYREFMPDDYLDDSIEIDEGMPIDSPIHFVLEVSGPTAGAVSFEFRFL